MKIFKKAPFIIMGLLILISLSSCSGRKTTDAPLEAIFPKDSMAVFVADYSDESQIENFRNLIDKFPEIKDKDQMLAGFKAGFNEGAKASVFFWKILLHYLKGNGRLGRPLVCRKVYLKHSDP